MTLLAATAFVAVVAAPAEAITNVTPPTVSGSPSPGLPLSCSDGSWSDPPLYVAKAWLKDGVANGSTGDTYLVVQSDLGHQISCEVDAADPNACIGPCGSTVAQSQDSLLVVDIPFEAELPFTPKPLSPPPAGICGSLRNFVIRIKQVGGTTYRSVKVWVDGAPAKVTRGKRWQAKIDMLAFTSGEVEIKIVARTTTGRKITGTRIYHPCHPEKLDGKKGRL